MSRLPPRRPRRTARGAGPRAAAHGPRRRACFWRAAAGPREGLRLVEALACRRCHTIGGKGNRLATNLDGVAWKRDQPALERSIARAGREHAAVRARRGPGGGDHRLPAALAGAPIRPGPPTASTSPRAGPGTERLREGVRRLPPVPGPGGPRRHGDRRAEPLRSLHAVLSRGRLRAGRRGPARPSPAGCATPARPGPRRRCRRSRSAKPTCRRSRPSSATPPRRRSPGTPVSRGRPPLLSRRRAGPREPGACRVAGAAPRSGDPRATFRASRRGWAGRAPSGPRAPSAGKRTSSFGARRSP